ncbi:pyridoxal phosphate-dependent aminotransferase [Candidatus Woesearchaeota archaeon]|nr:pyridoxal phosphate-dependent aminotransferase [Candidatus Woesearchaeota archaeon]
MTDKLSSPSMFIGIKQENLISFGSGQPDMPPPKGIYDILPKYTNFAYGLIQGEEKLRNSLRSEFLNQDADKDNFVITNGASEAIDLTFRSICKPKDKILIHAPYYYSYPPLLKANHIEPVITETIGGRIQIDDVEQKIHECKAILINSPSNPTGRIQEIKTLKEIEKLAKDLGKVIISDEVYKDLIYERENYMLSGDHVITINSFSKTFSMCGFRIGYLYSNDKSIVKRAIDIKTHSSMNTNILAQQMAIEALKTPKSVIEEQRVRWENRRDTIYKGLQDLGLDLWKPEGAFYVFPKIKNPRKTVWELYKNHDVITYLGEWFGSPNRIRLSYALETDKIEEGLRRIKNYINNT